MKIKDLLSKDIDRRINPAVVVSELDDYSIKQEIEEYVITDVLIKHLYTFLDSVFRKKAGKTGIWISGYYGSGKSHFIKYLYYCLNKIFSDRALSHYIEKVQSQADPLAEITPALANEVRREINNFDIDEIIFNIDEVSGQKDDNNKITRIFLNQLNKFRGYNDSKISLALNLEKHLDNLNVFGEFKNRISAEFDGERWDGNQTRFSGLYLDKIIEIAAEFDPEIDHDSLKNSILNENDYRITDLINELIEFIESKDANYRLIFFIDEVSQYIGSNTNLLLNLQTIIEEIGAKCSNKAWIVCTAQEDLSNLIDRNKSEDFGKILGRFETIISLQSQDAAFITKKRILDKNSDGLEALTEFYNNNKVAIENQFELSHELYENYSDKEDFLLTYPFIPYQFRLISDVFQSFSDSNYVGEGVKNTERSILGITHYTTKLCKEKKIGYFVPFDLFFNDQLEKNLTHYARNILDRAYNIKLIKEDKFAMRVVKLLFMISNLSESKGINFPANLDNLTILLMDETDMTRLDIQNRVQKVIDELIEKNIVQSSEGKIRFYKEDEIEIANEIKNTSLNPEDMLTYIYDDVISKILRIKPNVSFGNNNFKASVRVDEKEIIPRGDFIISFRVFDDREPEYLAMEVAKSELIACFNPWFTGDRELLKNFMQYARTKKYLKNSRDSATGSRAKALTRFSETNEVRLNEIRNKFQQNILDTTFVSNQQLLKPAAFKSGNSGNRFNEALERHLEAIYNKNYLGNGFSSNINDLKKIIDDKQLSTDKSLSAAEEEVTNKLNSNGRQMAVSTLIKKFSLAPYGWKDVVVIDILLRLAKKGFWRFEWKNEPVSLHEFVDKAMNSRERDSVIVLPEKIFSLGDIQEFIYSVNNDIFNKSILSPDITDWKEVESKFNNEIKKIKDTLEDLRDNYSAYPFAAHFKKLLNTINDISGKRDFSEKMSLVKSLAGNMKTQWDNYLQTEEFVNDFLENYTEIKKWAEDEKQNFDMLDDMLQVKSKKLLDFFDKDSPWLDFPQMKKIYRELYGPISQNLEELRKQARKMLEDIQGSLKAEADKIAVPLKNINTGIKEKMESLANINSITSLRFVIGSMDNVRADALKSMIDLKYQDKDTLNEKPAKETEIYSISDDNELIKTIETVNDAVKFAGQLKDVLIEKINNNKIVIIK